MSAQEIAIKNAQAKRARLGAKQVASPRVCLCPRCRQRAASHRGSRFSSA